MTARRTSSLAARFKRSEGGVAAIELALYAPFLSLLLLGGYDVARFTIIRAGVDKVGFSVADVTAQYDTLTSDAMKQVFDQKPIVTGFGTFFSPSLQEKNLCLYQSG